MFTKKVGRWTIKLHPNGWEVQSFDRVEGLGKGGLNEAYNFIRKKMGLSEGKWQTFLANQDLVNWS